MKPQRFSLIGILVAVGAIVIMTVAWSHRCGDVHQVLPVAKNYLSSRNSLVTHTAGCGLGRRILPKNRIWHATTRAAQENGRRACKRCRPWSQPAVRLGRALPDAVGQ